MASTNSTIWLKPNMQDVREQNRMELFITIYKETCNINYPAGHSRDVTDRALEHFDQHFPQEQDEGLSFPDPGEVLPPNEEDCIYTAPGPGGARPVREIKLIKSEGVRVRITILNIGDVVRVIDTALINPLTDKEEVELRRELTRWLLDRESQRVPYKPSTP